MSSRVLHVGKFYPPHHGGMERVVQTLCESTRGFVDNHVLVMHTGRGTVEDVVNGIPVTRVSALGAVGSVHIAPLLAAQLRRLTADLIVLHEPNPWALLSYAMARPRAPLAIWYHSDVVRPALQYALFYAPVAHTAYRRALRFVVSSPPLGAHAAALARYQSRLRVIPFGIDPAPWRGPDAADAGEPFVFFAGRHVEYKGVDVLLRALAGSRTHAVIAGDGPKRAAWEELARNLGLSARVTFTGDVDDAELRRLMQGCAAFVLPSVTRAEAFGYVQLEAMAAGKPVISTDVPSGVSWVNQHGRTGLVVRAGDPVALRAAIDQLMDDPVRRREMGAAGRARVDAEFTIERLRERLRAFYEELAVLPPWPAAC
jgi:glycosyltransferase involved in cell wall biosynthesis